MSLKIKQLQIDENSKKLKEYQEAFQKGYSKLNPAQKKAVKKTTITDIELLKAIDDQKSLRERIMDFFYNSPFVNK